LTGIKKAGAEDLNEQLARLRPDLKPLGRRDAICRTAASQALLIVSVRFRTYEMWGRQFIPAFWSGITQSSSELKL